MALPGVSPEEQAYINRLDSIRRASSQAVDANVAARTTNLVQTYRGISPGLAYALGRTGIGVGPQAEQLWQLELAQNMGETTGTRRKPKYGSKKKAAVGRLQSLAGSGVPDRLVQDLYEQVQLGNIDPWHLQAPTMLARRQGPDKPNEHGITAIQSVKNLIQAGREEGERKGPSFVSEQVGKGLQGVGKLLDPGNAALGADPIVDVAGSQKFIRDNLPTGRDAVRNVAIGAQGGYELLQATARDAMAGPFADRKAGDLWEQTTGYQTWVKGKSAGDGFLPNWNSPAMKAQAEAARKFSPYLIGGHAWTPGRAIADIPLDPDDDAFKLFSGAIDGSIALSRLDPASALLAGASDALAARKIIARTDDVRLVDRSAGGLAKGYRHFWAPKTGEDFFNTPGGYRFFDNLAKTTDDLELYEKGVPVMMRNVKFREAVKHASTPEEVYDLYRPYLGAEITQRPQIQGARVKMFGAMPPNHVDFRLEADLDVAAKALDDAGINAKFTREQRAKVQQHVGSGKRYAALDAFFDYTRHSLENAGWDAGRVDEAIQWEKKFTAEVADYGTDQFNDPLINPFLRMGDDTRPIPHAIFDNQFLNSAIQLPDARAVRRAVSGFAPMTNAGMYGDVATLADLAMTPWRKLMLMRPAWGIRVVAEEQMRIAAHGQASLVKHPLQFLAWQLGNPNDGLVNALETWHRGSPMVAETVRAVGGKLRQTKANFGRGRYALGGESFDNYDQYMEAIQHRYSAVWDENPKQLLHEWTQVDTADPHYAQALTEELARTNDARLTRGVLAEESPDAAKAWFRDGDGSSVREFMAQDPRMAPLKDNPAAADAQVDVVFERLKAIHMDNPELVEALRTGQINGIWMKNFDGSIRSDAVREVQRLVDEGHIVPPQVRTRKGVVLTEDQKAKHLRRLDYATDQIFDAMMPFWTRLYSRDPFARQTAWNKWEELLPSMDAKARADILRDAVKSNLDAKTITRMRETKDKYDALGDANRTGLIDTDTARDIGLRHSNKKTKELLYDLTERSRFFDAARLMFPFGEAWREVVTRWFKLTYENPQVLRRAQQGIMGARSPGSSAIGDAFGSSQSRPFFYKNNFGEEIVAFPGTEWLMSKDTAFTPGVPIPLTGSVQGMNMIGNGLPGLGPAAQIPVAWFLPDKPQFDGLAKLLFPYGRPEDNPFLGVADAFLPTYARRLKTALSSPDSTREYANTVMDVARYLASTGEYDLQGPDAQAEINRLLKDSKDKSRTLYFVRAAGSATLPSSPSPEWLVKDKKGKLVLQHRVADWWYKKTQSVGYDEALDDYFNKFGTDNFLLLQAKSESTLPGLDRTSSVKGSKWLRDNPDIKEKFPSTYALWSPDSPDFNYAEYEKQFASGERKPLTPKEAVALANNRLASHIYARALDKATAGGTKEDQKVDLGERATLRELRRELLTEFPGFDPDGSGAKVSTERLITELSGALDDPKLMRTRQGRALREYLTHRDEVIAAQRALDPAASHATLSSSASTAPLRAWLNEWGEYLVARNPRFSGMWDVLSREVEVE
jgi:hypothetical protein